MIVNLCLLSYLSNGKWQAYRNISRDKRPVMLRILPFIFVLTTVQGKLFCQFWTVFYKYIKILRIKASNLWRGSLNMAIQLNLADGVVFDETQGTNWNGPRNTEFSGIKEPWSLYHHLPLSSCHIRVSFWEIRSSKLS